MAEFTDYAENKILNLLRNIAWAQFPAYVALFTTAPNDAGEGTEVSGAGYARQLAGLSEAVGSGGATSNASDITFPTAEEDWGTVTHIALYDAESGGNMIMHSALDAEKAVGDGDTFKINAGDLDVTVA
ncbi:unnamed protein product [marine sediment metagenome]|uniref:Uncharacterized protein n=1 Tax=marine sediment metagenome TaxID=412755 RepID=X1FQY4_9ZZZZ